MTDHRAEINAQARVYLEELRAAAAAAHDRIRAGVHLHAQARTDDALPEEPAGDRPVAHADPIFATREFDTTPETAGGLVNFDAEAETDADGIPVWKD